MNLPTRKNWVRVWMKLFFNPADPRGITWGDLLGFPTQLDIFHRYGAKGCSDHSGFRAPSAYTAQLLTLHQRRANNQDRMAIKSTRL